MMIFFSYPAKSKTAWAFVIVLKKRDCRVDLPEKQSDLGIFFATQEE